MKDPYLVIGPLPYFAANLLVGLRAASTPTEAQKSEVPSKLFEMFRIFLKSGIRDIKVPTENPLSKNAINVAFRAFRYPSFSSIVLVYLFSYSAIQLFSYSAIQLFSVINNA